MKKTDRKAKDRTIKHTVYLDMKEDEDIIIGIESMRKTHVISYYIAAALREKLVRDNFTTPGMKAT